jgi:hypothetical protein
MKNLILISLLFLVSCKKDKNDTQSEDFKLVEESIINAITPQGVEIDINRVIVIKGNEYMWQGGNLLSGFVKVYGVTKNSSGIPENMGNLVINERQIPYVNNRYTFDYADQFFNEGKGMIGNDISVKINSNLGNELFKQIIYMPVNLLSYVDWRFPTSINKNQGITLYWTKEPKNINGKIYIKGIYQELMSVRENPGSVMPKNVNLPLLIVDDNLGQYTIPGSYFNSLPVGAYVSFSLSRGISYTTKDEWEANFKKPKISYITILESHSGSVILK